MAGDWIKFEVATPDKPEVWVIANQLNIDPDAVVGKLLRIWTWFDQHTEKGNAPSVTKMLLDRSVGVAGFCDAVIAAGWMMESSDSVELPNFERHNGKSAKKRAVTAKRVAKHKDKTNASSNADGNANSVSEALPREEKIIEDINNTPPISPPRGNSSDPIADTQAGCQGSTRKNNKTPYDRDFEAMWAEYPTRAGNNPKKRAWSAWSSRLKEGESKTAIRGGVKRYAAYCQNTGKIRSEFVMQAATFFGPEKPYLQPWEPPANQPPPGGHFAHSGFGELNYADGIAEDGRF